MDGEVGAVTEAGAHLGELLSRLLVAVLAEVSRAEVVEQQHVADREVLRHDDEGHLAGVTTSGDAGRFDARPDR